MRKIVARITVSLALIAGSLVAGGTAANASVPVDPTGCFDTHTVTGTTTLTFSFTVYCPRVQANIQHGITLSNGSTLVTKTGSCQNVSRCTVSKSIPNPAGSQYFQYSDEWRAVDTGGAFLIDTGIKKYAGNFNK